MSLSMARRHLLLSLPAWPALLTACSGNGGPPRIDSFTASSTHVVPGRSASLLAQFEDGDGVIDQGVGPVRSGVPIEITPDGDIVYTLTVSNENGEVTAQVSVHPGLFRSWDFAVDTPETWGDPNADIIDGQLVVNAWDSQEQGQCLSGYTQHVDDDERWLSGAYGALRLSAVLSFSVHLSVRYGELMVDVDSGVPGSGDVELVLDIPETGTPVATFDGIPVDPSMISVNHVAGGRNAAITFYAVVSNCDPSGGQFSITCVRTLRLESV